MMDDEENLWECPICFEKMHDIAFPFSHSENACTHSFCMDCMKDLCESAKQKSQLFQCPLCRRQINGFVKNQIATKMLQELDKYKEQLRESKDREKDTHRRERKLVVDNGSISLKVAHLEGELTKAVSDRQCETDRNEHLKKMCKLVEMEKETLSERLQDLQKKLQAELEESSRRIGIMENEVSEYQHQLHISTEETTKSENQNRELMVKIRDTEMRIAQATEERKATEAKVLVLEGELARAVAEAKRELAEQDAVVNDLRMRMQLEVRKAHAEHEASVEDLRAKLQASGAFEKRVREMEQRTSFLEAELKRAKEEMVRSDRRATELDLVVRKTEMERAGTGQVVSQLEVMLGTYKEEMKMLEREKYECTKKAAELEGLVARMRSDAQKSEEEKVVMKERVWKAERDQEVMRQERDKMKMALKERDERQGDTYLSGWMKNLKPLSTAIWGEQRSYGPLVRNSNDYFVLERRGSRKDGRVWRCKAKQTGTFFALKTLILANHQNAQGATDLTVFREAMLLKAIDHPNIISLDGVFRDVKGNLCLLISPFVEIDLDYSIGQKTMNALEVKNLLYQLLVAIAYMHKQDLVHRNIKPTSILRFEDYTLKLCSFNYARSVLNQSIDMITPKQPLWYTAPEVLQAHSSVKAQAAIDWKSVDIWAIGCVFAEMLLQTPLFAGGSDAIATINAMLDKPKNSSGALYPAIGGNQTLSNTLAKSPYVSHPSFRSASALLRTLLVLDPASRCTAAQALQHEYFADLHQEQARGNNNKNTISREVQDTFIPRFVETECYGLL